MADNSRFTIICPCCEATLTIDAQTGALLTHEEKAKPLASFDEMVKGLDKQKAVREQIFAQELNQQSARVDIGGDGLTVHRHGDGGHACFLLGDRSWSGRPFVCPQGASSR